MFFNPRFVPKVVRLMVQTQHLFEYYKVVHVFLDAFSKAAADLFCVP